MNSKIPKLEQRVEILANQIKDIENSGGGGGGSSFTPTEAQLAAMNSGIDSTEVAQIGTNATNIGRDEAALIELVDSGAKNFIKVGFTSKPATATAPSITNNGDGSITLNGSNTKNSPVIVRDIGSDLAELYTLPAGVYELYGSGNEDVILRVYAHDGTGVTSPVQLASISTSIAAEFLYTSSLKSAYPYIYVELYIKSPTAEHEVSFDNVIVRPMVCTKAAWDISRTYVPYRPSEDEQNAQIAQNTSDIANNGLKVVLSQQSNSSSSYTYQMKTNDFPVPYSCGCYLISIISWGTTPTYSLYSVAYSESHTDYTVITKIAGNDASVTVNGDTISITSSGKVTIMAMR